MTDEDARKVAREVVREMFGMIGLSADEPAEARELQRDFQFIRSWRQSSDAVKRQGLLTAVGIVTAGILGLIWMAFKHT